MHQLLWSFDMILGGDYDCWQTNFFNLEVFWSFYEPPTLPPPISTTTTAPNVGQKWFSKNSKKSGDNVPLVMCIKYCND